jgi:hypothetical protein
MRVIYIWYARDTLLQIFPRCGVAYTLSIPVAGIRVSSSSYWINQTAMLITL